MLTVQNPGGGGGGGGGGKSQGAPPPLYETLVTLNFNVDIGDKGAQEFAEALRDDVCLRGMYVHVG